MEKRKRDETERVVRLLTDIVKELKNLNAQLNDLHEKVDFFYQIQKRRG